MTTDKPSIAEMMRRELEAYAECPRVWIEEHNDDDGELCWCPKRWCDMNQIDCRVCTDLKEQNRDRADIKLWRAAQGDRLAIAAPVLLEIAAAAMAYHCAQQEYAKHRAALHTALSDRAYRKLSAEMTPITERRDMTYAAMVTALAKVTP